MKLVDQITTGILRGLAIGAVIVWAFIACQ
jgi:hypothetical protein